MLPDFETLEKKVRNLSFKSDLCWTEVTGSTEIKTWREDKKEHCSFPENKRSLIIKKTQIGCT
jgi:hypothetical protein